MQASYVETVDLFELWAMKLPDKRYETSQLGDGM